MISSAPQALTAVQGASSITLSWTDSAVIGGGTLSYRIYISTNGGTTWSSETDVTGTSYAWSGLTYSTDYSFMVRAINTGSTVAGPQSNMQTSTPLSNTNAITSFTLTDGTTTWTGTINDQAGTVTATVPSGTDVTNLTPTIGTTGASIAPVSGIAQDFTNPQTYTVTAVDGRTRSYTVVVNSLIDAQTPEITGQPQSVTVYVGETAQLSVTSSVGDGGTLSYQWYLNISDSNSGGTAITDGTGTSAAFFAPTITTGIFYYYVVVTNTNNSATGSVTASVTSDVASVTVNPTPIIAPIVLPLVSGAWGGTDPNDPLWTYDSANNMLYVKSGEVIDISGTVSGNLQIVTSPGGAATVNAVGDVLLYSGDTLTLGAGVTLTVSDGAAIKNEGSLGNSGTINNTPNGVINNQPAGTINNQNGAEIINDGTINNEGTINNNGTMSGNGSLNNIDSGVVIAPPTGGNSGNGSGGNGSGSGDGGISAPAPAPPPAPGLAPPPVVPDDPQASDDTTDLTTPSTGHAPFVDISQSHWAQRDIDVLWSRGIMRGVSDTIFAPNEKLTEPCW
ncbi:MAG: fibronectin type III domain-containing protein [Oscillospiraceae bacterium]|nr:fibronectin type III domain-containing protein [Oscillospiraceae bacterium]